MIIRYKTKTELEFTLVGERKSRTGYIYIEVFSPVRESTGYRPRGNYYTYIQTGTKNVVSVDENGDEITTTEPIFERRILSAFSGIISFEDVKYIEDTFLQDFTNQRNLDLALIQRTIEFTLLKIDLEHAEDNDNNWGITSSDLEEIINKNN